MNENLSAVRQLSHYFEGPTLVLPTKSAPSTDLTLLRLHSLHDTYETHEFKPVL